MGMLRDLNVSSGGRRDSTDPQVGKPASQIPTGFALAALLVNDIDASYPNRLYSVEILGQPSAGTLFVGKAGEVAFTGAPDGVYSGPQRIRKYDPGVGLVSTEDTTYSFTIGSGGQQAGSYATYISETFQSVAGGLRTNLAGMRWYVWAQVAPTPFGAPIAQGVTETTDSAGTSLISISGQTAVAPGAAVTLGFTNSNGDPAQADLMSWFGTVVAH